MFAPVPPCSPFGYSSIPSHSIGHLLELPAIATRRITQCLRKGTWADQTDTRRTASRERTKAPGKSWRSLASTA
jgi:hypothetical protein